MKKTTFLRIILLLAISCGLQIALYEIWHRIFSKEKPVRTIENENEYFDPSLMRITSVQSFVEYCDSIYGSKIIASGDSSRYATIIEIVLRGRFYHGYSYYKLGNNFIAHLVAPILHKDLSAIVIPDDILKYPNAACSQQSIIGMEVFKKKGFDVRKVGFFLKGYGGHFCFEAKYGGKWHYFDPDMEPKIKLLIERDHPSIAELNKNDSLLKNIYMYKEGEYMLKLLKTSKYGKVNEFPAKNALVYQYFTKFLSYTLWFWFYLLYVAFKRRYNK